MNFTFQKILLITILLNSSIIGNQEELTLSSPNNNLRLSVGIENIAEEDSCLIYNISYKDKLVIHKSRLGLNTVPKGVNANTWQNKLSIIKSETSSHREIWNPVYGERSKIANNYNELILTLESNNRTRGIMNVILRIYDEGIAFKYYFPKGHNGGGHIRIASDITQFTMPSNTKGYFTEYAQGKYQFKFLSEWKNEIERPFTLELSNGLYVSLTEAEVANFCKTNFVIDESNKNRILCSMYDSVDEMEPFATPWRVIMVAETAGELIENNDIILNLNPPSQIEETSWIKPGKVMREFTLSTNGAKKLVDFAVEQNLQYIHFDAGWYGHEFDYNEDASTVTVDPERNPKGDLDLQEAINYAKSKGLGVIIYVNQRALATQLDKILPIYKSWGISGIKFGFVQVGSHIWTKWLHEAVKKCAEYELMVDIHDGYRPTGFSRTFPNLMTQEGIGGNEIMPDAVHNTTLPFTRFIAGAADYTYCYFYREEFGHPKRHIQNTSAHQLALPVVFYSPWQFLYWYDKPSDYQDEPELEFWKNIPTTWDDTKVINGKIGEFITVARKSGSNWFLGSITNTEARVLEIPLLFLDSDKKYEAVIYSDNPSINTRTHVGVSKIKADSESVITVRLKASGGSAIHIKELD